MLPKDFQKEEKQLPSSTSRQPRISAGEFAVMVTSGYLGLGIFYFPRSAVSVAGRGGLYSLWTAGLAAFALMALVFKMNRLIPNETLSGYSSSLLSKPIGFLVGAYTIAYHLAVAVSATVLFSYVLGNIFLPNTPIWAINGILVVTSSYMAYGGAAVLARTLQASYVPTFLLSILSILFAFTMVRHPLLFMPTPVIQLLPILHGAYLQCLVFIGFEVSVTLYPYIRQEQRQRAERYSYLGLAIVLLVLTLNYETILATFGPQLVGTLRWPVVSMFRIISVSAFFIDKLGSLIIMLWTIVIVAFLAVRFWCLSHDLVILVHYTGKRGYQYGIWINAFLTWIGANLLPNSKIADIANLTWIIPLGLGYLLVIPIVVLVVGTIRKEWVDRFRASSDLSSEEG